MAEFTLTDQPYSAKIVRLKDIKTSNKFDKLNIATIYGNETIIPKTYNIDDYVLYFPRESRVNESLLRYCNLFKDSSKNRDTSVVGTINNNRRIRPFNLRGVASVGMCIDFDKFVEWYNLYLNIESKDVITLKNLEFNNIDDIIICEKYTNKPKESGDERVYKPKSDPKVPEQLEGQFEFHKNTNFLENNLGEINPKDRLVITYKMNGTSCIVGNLLYKPKVNKFKKFLIKLFNINTKKYKIIYSSRRVVRNPEIKDKTVDRGLYYDDDVIYKTASDIVSKNLPCGYCIYFEIVGYYDNGEYIQPGYDYGVEKGKFDIYVYRATYTSEDNSPHELSYESMCDFVKNKLLLKPVPLLYNGIASSLVVYDGLDVDLWRKILLDKIKDNFTGKNCYICKNTVPAEGVVVRIQDDDFYTNDPNHFKAYKYKPERFYNRQTELIDNGYIDVEDLK
jgi:hypothetical protein